MRGFEFALRRGNLALGGAQAVPAGPAAAPPTPRPAPAAISDTDGDVDLYALLRALWAKRLWIVGPTLAAFVGALVFVTTATPVYRSESRILIENRENAFLRPEIERNAQADRSLVDQEAVASQAQLLMSRDLARQVIRQLKLGERAEFDPHLGGLSLVGLVRGLIGMDRKGGALSAEDRALRSYFDKLKVYPVDKSRVIVVEFESEDSELAARVANAITEAYLGLQQLVKQDSTRQASVWLLGEIEKMRQKVAESEGRVEDFRAKSNLFVGTNNTQLSNQQLGELNSQLVLARAQRADYESKARLIREMLRAGKSIEVSDVTNSELIRRLVEQRVTLMAQLAEQSSTLLEQHPRIKELRAQIGGLEYQIRGEAERLVRVFENDARVAGGRVETLSASLDQLKRQAAGSGEQDVQLRALEREARSQRDILEAYLTRYRESTARDNLTALPADARVISRAMASNDPAFPKKLPIVLLATIAAFVFSVGIVATGELIGGQVHRAAPTASRIPFAIDAPPTNPVVAEAIAPVAADALTGLVRAVRDCDPRCIVVAAARAGGDAAGIARRLARRLSADVATVLVELAPAKPVESIVSDPTAAGIADLVRGTASFGQVIHRDRASRLHVVPLGGPEGDIGALIGAPRFREASAALAQTYDHVVVATPSADMLAAADLGALAQMAIVVAPADWTPAEAEATYDALSAAGFGILLSVPEAAGRDTVAAKAPPTAKAEA